LAEWSIAAVLKTVVPRGTVGSNPTFSAKPCERQCLQGFFLENSQTAQIWHNFQKENH